MADIHIIQEEAISRSHSILSSDDIEINQIVPNIQIREDAPD